MTELPVPLLAGPIDVHAHLLDEDCYAIPTAHGDMVLTEVDGDLHLGEFPIRTDRRSLSDPAVMVADMDAVGISVRLVAPPPYAFALDAPIKRSGPYARRVNEGVAAACATAPDRLLGLGMVPAADADAAVVEMRRIAGTAGMAGITLPSLVGGRSFESDPLRAIACEAARLGLSVLVHPMQSMAAGLGHHYLQNLLGNPTETAAAIAALVLSGLAEAEEDLRMAFVHGGGCAPFLLGRWDHGWRARQDVHADSTTIPSRIFRDRVFVDLLTHDEESTRFLLRVAGADRVLLGSDYPWDMGLQDPVSAAQHVGVSLLALTANARRFLGLQPSSRIDAPATTHS